MDVGGGGWGRRSLMRQYSIVHWAFVEEAGNVTWESLVWLIDLEM